MNPSEFLNSKGVTSPVTKRKEPLWKGPMEDGVTFSMLSRFLVCRERFRIHVMEGLRPVPEFNHRIEYGHMWHVCEEALAREPDNFEKVAVAFGGNTWDVPLKAYCQQLCEVYPLQQEQIQHWYNVCKVQFPIYATYWRHNDYIIVREHLVQEQVFDVPYTLPDGRTVRLRGKFDSVDLIGGPNGPLGIYLGENKTKGDINEQQILRQLKFDLQTMLYLTVLVQDTGIDAIERVKMGKKGGKKPPYKKSLEAVKGVRYNVVRRPLSGGKGSIVRHKAKGSKPEETYEEYYERLRCIIFNEPDTYFMRWKVEVSSEDIFMFQARCLNPLLINLCDWYDAIVNGLTEYSLSDGDGNYPNPDGLHWQHPFGVRNILDEGGSSDLDEYLSTGSTVGLRSVDKLFTELT